MTPRISCIVVTYLPENRKYLDLCLASLMAQTHPALEIILVSSQYCPTRLPLGIKHVHSAERMHYPEAVNFGVLHASPDSTHLMLLNDDVILNRNALQNLDRTAGDGKFIINAMSNCDNGFLFMAGQESFPYPIEHRFGVSYEDGRAMATRIQAAPSGPRLAVSVPFVCFYATLIPRQVWELVGPLDERFKTGHDDEDYCMRARQHGIPALVDFSAFIFHFGGRTADLAISEEQRRENAGYFYQKWSGGQTGEQATI